MCETSKILIGSGQPESVIYKSTKNLLSVPLFSSLIFFFYKFLQMSSIVLDTEKSRSIPEDLEKISSEKEPSEQYITPPDGGRGWLIVFSCFMVRSFISLTLKTD